MTLVIDTALGLRLELGLALNKQLVKALSRADVGASHDAGRIVVHGRALCALVCVMAISDSRRRVIGTRIIDGDVRQSCWCLPVARLVVAQLVEAVFAGKSSPCRPSGGRDGYRMNGCWIDSGRDAAGRGCSWCGDLRKITESEV